MPRHLEEGSLPGKGHALWPPCLPLLEPCLLRSPAFPSLQDSPDTSFSCPQQHWPANHSYLDTLGLKHLAFKIPSPHPHCTLCPWGLPSLATSQSSVSVQPTPVIISQGSLGDPAACLSVFSMSTSSTFLKHPCQLHPHSRAAGQPPSCTSPGIGCTNSQTQHSTEPSLCLAPCGRASICLAQHWP